jgi:hypothetical protein
LGDHWGAQFGGAAFAQHLWRKAKAASPDWISDCPPSSFWSEPWANSSNLL